MSSNIYAGLGASLGVPQSALESITSFDPKDYVYPSVGDFFSFPSMEEQFAGSGMQEQMHVFSLEQSAHIRGRGYSSEFSSVQGANLFGQVGFGDVVGDLDPESLNYLKLNEYDTKAISEEYSEKSCATAAGARVSPRRNTAISARKGAQTVMASSKSASEEEDEDLLVSAGSGFHGLDTEILQSQSVEAVQGESLSKNSTGKRSRRLSLSLDYEAAVASINSALDNDQGRKTLDQPAQVSKKLRLKTKGVKPSDSSESSPCNIDFVGLGESNIIAL
jgi:hypothetical protein